MLYSLSIVVAVLLFISHTICSRDISPAFAWDGVTKNKEDNMSESTQRMKAKVFVQIVMKCEKRNKQPLTPGD